MSTYQKGMSEDQLDLLLKEDRQHLPAVLEEYVTVMLFFANRLRPQDKEDLVKLGKRVGEAFLQQWHPDAEETFLQQLFNITIQDIKSSWARNFTPSQHEELNSQIEATMVFSRLIRHYSTHRHPLLPPEDRTGET